AEGISIIADAAELRVKESDRIEALCEALASLGVYVEALPDGMRIRGPQPPRGGVADSHGDHRLAMALAVAALAGSAPSVVKRSRCVGISFPNFARALAELARAGGGQVEEVHEA
ncbi:MAG: 3-phosphoshikimate 1-carboxyvinyltransferase, partial [Bacillota bacterium]